MISLHSNLFEGHRSRKNIDVGTKVKIVTKENQGTKNYTEGEVGKILTNKKKHPHGIKVRLKTGEVGRVQEIIKWIY